MKTRPGWWVAGLLTGAALLAGCSDDGGSSGAGSPAGGSGQSAGGSSQSAGGSSQSAGGSSQNGGGSSQNGGGSGNQPLDCSACKSSQCKNEGAACDADPTCASAHADLVACGKQHPTDPAICTETFDHTSGSVGLALSACADKALSDSQAGVGACAKACNCVIGSTCGDCVFGACCDPLLACIQDAACNQTYYADTLPCLLTTNDLSAQVQCVEQLKAKGGVAAPLGDCMLNAASNTCASSCK